MHPEHERPTNYHWDLCLHLSMGPLSANYQWTFCQQNYQWSFCQQDYQWTFCRQNSQWIFCRQNCQWTKINSRPKLTVGQSWAAGQNWQSAKIDGRSKLMVGQNKRLVKISSNSIENVLLNLKEVRGKRQSSCSLPGMENLGSFCLVCPRFGWIQWTREKFRRPPTAAKTWYLEISFPGTCQLVSMGGWWRVSNLKDHQNHGKLVLH